MTTKTKMVTLRLDPETIAMLKELSKLYQLTMSLTVSCLIRDRYRHFNVLGALPEAQPKGGG